MPKRYTDTDKWKKDWFINLTPVEKSFWIYLCDTCTNAGIWNVGWKSAEFHIGATLDKTSIEKTFEKQFIKLDDGKRWFLIDFIPFQQKRLNPNNPSHKGIIEELRRHSLLSADLSILLPDNKLKVPLEVLGSTYSNSNSNSNSNSKDIIKSKNKIEYVIVSQKLLSIPNFKEAFDDYIEYRNAIKKPITAIGIKRALMSLAREEFPVAVIEYAIDKNWQGLKWGLPEDMTKKLRAERREIEKYIQKKPCKWCGKEFSLKEIEGHEYKCKDAPNPTEEQKTILQNSVNSLTDQLRMK